MSPALIECHIDDIPPISSAAQTQAALNLAHPLRAEIKAIEPMKRLSTVFVKTSALHQHRCRQDRRESGQRLRATIISSNHCSACEHLEA
jgi:hypothetical protein